MNLLLNKLCSINTISQKLKKYRSIKVTREETLPIKFDTQVWTFNYSKMEFYRHNTLQSFLTFC